MPDTLDFLVLDVETAGGSSISFPHGFELLLTGVRFDDTYGMFTADPASLAELSQLLRTFRGPIVTFDGTRFDVPVLEFWTEKLLREGLPTFLHYDLSLEIVKLAGYRIGLERVSLYTFGEKKAAWDHRRNAAVWKTSPHLLVDYNRVDLDLTHELFLRVLRREPLFLGDKTIVLPGLP